MDQRSIIEVALDWAKKELRAAGLPTAPLPYELHPGGGFEVVSWEKVEALEAAGRKALALRELVEALGASRKLVLAARVLRDESEIRHFYKLLKSRDDPELTGRIDLFVTRMWRMAAAYTEAAIEAEPSKVGKAGRKVASERADRERWRRELEMADRLRAEGLSERKQAEAIAEALGGDKDVIRIRLRRMRGTASRGKPKGRPRTKT